MKYLLDTNIISEPLRPKPSKSVMRRLREHEDDIAIPAPVWHELRFGCARLAPSRQREAIERYIEDVDQRQIKFPRRQLEIPTQGIE